MSVELVKHAGGCHCGRVRFEVMAPEVVQAYDCNCSFCVKRQNKPVFVVPGKNFKLLQGKDSVTVYTYGTGTAKHTFCKVCGVQSFYTPRLIPDGMGVAVHCLDSGTLKEVKIIHFDGQNWEEAVKTEDQRNTSKT